MGKHWLRERRINSVSKSQQITKANILNPFLSSNMSFHINPIAFSIWLKYCFENSLSKTSYRVLFQSWVCYVVLLLSCYFNVIFLAFVKIFIFIVLNNVRSGENGHLVINKTWRKSVLFNLFFFCIPLVDQSILNICPAKDNWLLICIFDINFGLRNKIRDALYLSKDGLELVNYRTSRI